MNKQLKPKTGCIGNHNVVAMEDTLSINANGNRCIKCRYCGYLKKIIK